MHDSTFATKEVPQAACEHQRERKADRSLSFIQSSLVYFISRLCTYVFTHRSAPSCGCGCLSSLPTRTPTLEENMVELLQLRLHASH